MKRLLYSIIICTCNRPDLLVTALKTIAAQKTTDEFSFELIIVDNSPGGTMKPAVDSVRNLFTDLTYLQEKRRGKSFALNCGVQSAKGDILTFTDDDITAPDDWLIRLHTKFQQYGCDGIGGRVLPVYPPETPAWVKKNAVQLAGGVVIYDYGEGDFLHTSKHYQFIGANFAFKRQLFEKFGSFRTDLGPGQPAMGEDTEITDRFLKNGCSLYYCGSVVMWHPVDLKRLELKPLAKWHISLGRYAAKMEIENNVKIDSYFFCIPRYLYKRLILDGIKIVFSCYNRMLLINAWRSFFRCIGLMKEYREQKAKKN